MEDNHDLQAYFNQRIQGMLSKYGKKMVGWDEIFHPDLPNDIVIQSWRGQESLAESARQSYQGILSNGYYLDHILSAAQHYQVDPLSGAAAELSPDEKEAGAGRRSLHVVGVRHLGNDRLAHLAAGRGDRRAALVAG